MTESIDHLLTPRYEVIADYPDSPYSIGYILKRSIIMGEELWDVGGKLFARDPEKFPAIFKPLAWWEYRSPEEMPKYVKFNNVKNPSVHKVDRFDFESTSKWWMFLDKGIHPYNPEDFLPATESDYLNYQNSLK